MRLIIAGSREITELQTVYTACLQSGFWPVSVVVSGGARGIDALGEQWATAHNILIERVEADWALHGKGAGPIRNRKMAGMATHLVLIWDGKSRGSKSMLDEAIKRRLKIYVYRTDDLSLSGHVPYCCQTLPLPGTPGSSSCTSK